MSIISPGPQTTWQGRIRIVTPILLIREVRPWLSDMAKPYAPFRTESSTWTWSPQQGSIPQAQHPHACLDSSGRQWQEEYSGCLSLLDESLHPEARERDREKPRAGQGSELLLRRLMGILSQRSTEESRAGGRRQPSTRRSQGRHPPAGLHLSFLLPVPCSPLLFGKTEEHRKGSQAVSGPQSPQALPFNSLPE